jgi:hypothetical protein
MSKNNKIFICVLAITGFILGVMAFVPYKKDLNCENSSCDGAFIPPGSICSLGDDNKKKCYVKKHRYYLIIPSIVLLGISILKYYNEIYKPDIATNKINNVEMTEEEFLDDLYN